MYRVSGGTRRDRRQVAGLWPGAARTTHAVRSAVASNSCFGVPDDDAAFWQFADDLAALLKNGDAILMHCGAGIGRTGTMATAVLMALGVTRDAALRAVQAAGSHPETPSQRRLLESRDGR